MSGPAAELLNGQVRGRVVVAVSVQPWFRGTSIRTVKGLNVSPLRMAAPNAGIIRSAFGCVRFYVWSKTTRLTLAARYPR